MSLLRLEVPKNGSGAARTHRTIDKAIIRIRQETCRSQFARESAGVSASGTGIPLLKASAGFVDRKTADVRRLPSKLAGLRQFRSKPLQQSSAVDPGRPRCPRVAAIGVPL